MPPILDSCDLFIVEEWTRVDRGERKNGRLYPVAPRLNAEVSESVWRALSDESEQSGDSLSTVVDRALATAFDLERHSLFQVSTSNALVQGVFSGAVTVAGPEAKWRFRTRDFRRSRRRADHARRGLLPGHWRRSGHLTTGRRPGALRGGHPFPPRSEPAHGPGLLGRSDESLDASRPSENLFVGIRVDGRFERLSLRAACAAESGENLLEATAHQSEFTIVQEEGTLVGFWAPLYARAVNVPGYHFHFISEDRTSAGICSTWTRILSRSGIHVESELHIAIPETEEFLTADLSGDHQEALHQAEDGGTTERGDLRELRM